MSKDTLIIPVYLNQRILFDFMSMLQDGLSTVTRVTESRTSDESDKKRYGASFGLNEALSTLLKINLSGDREKTGSKGNAMTSESEKIHTPASLLYNLRKMLKANKHLVSLTKEALPKHGDIVEFKAEITRNPIIETMNSMHQAMKLAVAFEDKPSTQNQRKKANKQSSEFSQIAEQINSFREELQTGGTIDILSKVPNTSYRVVVTLEEDFLNDKTMADIVDGTFTIFGKIIRLVEDNKQSISLIRKTALSIMGKKTLEEVFGNFQNLDDSIKLPKLEWDIKGPALQILPIAIFA